MNSQNISIWIRYFFPVFLALFLGILIYMLAQFREAPGFTWYVLFWLVGSVFLIWEMGWWIGRLLDRQNPWHQGVFKRLSLHFLASNLFGITLFVVCYVLLNWYETKVLGSDNALGLLHITVAIGKAFIIVQLVNSVQISYQLLENFQKVKLEAERIRKEKVIGHLEMLRQKIDAPLLHANFTVLEELIQESPHRASAYVKELSEHYQHNQSHLAAMLSKIQKTLEVKEDQAKEAVLTTSLTKTAYKTRFLVRSGNRYLLFSVRDIMAFYKDEVVLLFTKDGKKYAVDQSLEEIIGQLSPEHFFRINRQCIVHDRYLDEMRMEGGQMQIRFNGNFPGNSIVSQRNLSHFKKWLAEQ
ncbi:MAG: LytTR family DNA-binding domain-containing protein [Bacteroidota bacterium]